MTIPTSPASLKPIHAVFMVQQQGLCSTSSSFHLPLLTTGLAARARRPLRLWFFLCNYQTHKSHLPCKFPIHPLCASTAMLKFLCILSTPVSMWAHISQATAMQTQKPTLYFLLLSGHSMMVSGKALSDDARHIIIRLYQSRLFTMHDLARVIDIHQVTIHQIVAQHECMGHLQQEGTRTGRSRLLDYVDTQVSAFFEL